MSKAIKPPAAQQQVEMLCTSFSKLRKWLSSCTTYFENCFFDCSTYSVKAEEAVFPKHFGMQIF